jgi:hypothetical protein
MLRLVKAAKPNVLELVRVLSASRDISSVDW